MRVVVFGLAMVLVPFLPPRVETTRPVAKVRTDAVPSEGDAADDPAIWIHPVDPARSLVLGTDKKGGLHTYALDGHQVQLISPESRPNNVDLLYEVRLPGRDGVLDLAIATVGKGDTSGVKIWTIDPADGRLAKLGEGPTFRVHGGKDAYGLCVYRSPHDGSTYVFASNREGTVEQYRLDFTTPIRATLVRTFAVGSQAEGMVADRETGRLFVAEEDVGIWEYGAEPDSGSKRILIAKVGDYGLAADVEGLALYYAGDGGGYLLVSSQGSSTIVAFERASSHNYVLTIDPAPGVKIDDVAHTDGIEVTNERTSPQFPRGLLVVQDGENEGRQDFKLFAWDEVVGSRLVVDPSASARQASARRP